MVTGATPPTPADQPGQRPQPERLNLGGVRNDAHRRAVVLPEGVPGHHGGIGVVTAEHGQEPGQLLHRRVGPDVFVAVDSPRRGS
jgi:hypothetical protein